MVMTFVKCKTEGISFKEALVGGGLLAVAFVFLGFVFYRSLFMMALGLVLGFLLGPSWWHRYQEEKRREKLRGEFKEALYCLVVALRAGRSLEGAFEASLEDMDPSVTPLLYQEWKTIVGQMKIGFPVEESLRALGEKSGISEILSFTRAVEICKRSEGNIASVLETTIKTLQERMDVQAKMRVIVAQKKMEQRIMSLAPFGVIGLLMILSPKYLTPLYTSFQGRLVMTICVFLSIASILLARKMATIDF